MHVRGVKKAEGVRGPSVARGSRLEGQSVSTFQLGLVGFVPVTSSLPGYRVPLWSGGSRRPR